MSELLMWILLIMFIMLAIPCVVFVFYKIFRFVYVHQKVKRGYYMIHLVHDNGRIEEHFAKPDAGVFKIGGTPYPFSNYTGMVLYKGFIPLVTYHKNSQVNFSDVPKSKADLENINTILQRVYNLGKLAAMKSEKILMLIGMATVVLVLISLYMQYQSTTAMNTMLLTKFQELAELVKTLQPQGGVAI